jgi:hypothetical protein
MNMSNSSGLPNPTDAYNYLFNNVHAQVFLNKLASYGIVPNTEAEVSDLFALAGQLRHIDSSDKQASDSSRFGYAVAGLNDALNSTPEGQIQQAYEQDYAVKQATYDLANDPSIYSSILSLKAHEAAVLAGNS